LCFTNESLKFSDAKEIIDILPYVRYERPDRKDKSGVALNSRVVANVISLSANRVMCADIHTL
jgi:phosphoribosylpyrophosphate synthetase